MFAGRSGVAIDAGRGRPGRVYNISVGAWGARNYLEFLKSAVWLRPRIVVVALYTGNDPLTGIFGAYGNSNWRRFAPDPELEAADAPTVQFPPPPEQI